METRRITPSEVESAILESRIEELREILVVLSSKYGWIWNGRPKTISILQALSSSACERQIVHTLQHSNERSESKFDPVFKLKSEYATLRIIEELQRRLATEGIAARIAAEVRSEFGIYDVVISDELPNDSDSGIPLVKVEIKASLGLPLDQIERYLWDPTPLILVRVLTGQVMLLRPSKLTGFVNFSVENAIAKARRIIEAEHPTEVAGPQCHHCRDFSCKHNRHKPESKSFIQLKDEDFGADLESFLENLPQVAEKTAILVVQELKSRVVNGAPEASDS